MLAPSNQRNPKMKITKKYLKQLIIETINEVSINEQKEKDYDEVEPGDLVEVSQSDYDRDITFYGPSMRMALIEN